MLIKKALPAVILLSVALAGGALAQSGASGATPGGNSPKPADTAAPTEPAQRVDPGAGSTADSASGSSSGSGKSASSSKKKKKKKIKTPKPADNDNNATPNSATTPSPQ